MDPLMDSFVNCRPPASEVTALVIDDEEDTRYLLAELITTAGYSVRTAANGQEALDLLRHIRPHVIFVDLQMPVMNGAEFRQAQRRDRALLEIPTVVLTGTNDEPLLDLAIEETLVKPARVKQLLEIVRRHAA
jgi:CheY-like chemotaxis protein